MSAAILAAAVSAYAQGNGQAGITEATNLITGYFDPGTKLVYAIGAVCGLIGGIENSDGNTNVRFHQKDTLDRKSVV